MINNIKLLTNALLVIAGTMVILIIILVAVYLNMKLKEKKKDEKIPTNDAQVKKSKIRQYTIGSVFDFMNFDKIEDNMIVQKNGSKYLMVVECKGVNYDLMSNEEKVSVEEGFIQFLNTLSSPVQIYVQTRKINLDASLQNYKEKMNTTENEYRKQQMRYKELSEDPNVSEEVLKKEYYELVKQKNLYEYGKDIIYNTEKMSLNKNILNKKYYVILSYYTSELGQNNMDKNEIGEIAFSELYTKCQSVIRALSISGVMGKVLSSTELVELLYVAYNRDDSDVYGIEKAINARYNEIYSTAPDYIDKKIQLLDEEISKRAYDKANNAVIKAESEKEKRYKQKQESIDDIIDSLAELLIDQNSNNIGPDIAEKAKEEIEKGKERTNVQKESKKRRTNSNRT